MCLHISSAVGTTHLWHAALRAASLRPTLTRHTRDQYPSVLSALSARHTWQAWRSIKNCRHLCLCTLHHAAQHAYRCLVHYQKLTEMGCCICNRIWKQNTQPNKWSDLKTVEMIQWHKNEVKGRVMKVSQISCKYQNIWPYDPTSLHTDGVSWSFKLVDELGLDFHPNYGAFHTYVHISPACHIHRLKNVFLSGVLHRHELSLAAHAWCWRGRRVVIMVDKMSP